MDLPTNPTFAAPTAHFVISSPSPPSAQSGAWRGLVWPPMTGGVLDRFSLSAGEGLGDEDGRTLVVGRFGNEGPFARLRGASIARDWPAAIRVKTGAFGFDVTPHAGVSLAGGGDSRDAGALVRFGRGLGLAQDEAGRRSKWYLFASANQETLGLNFVRGQEAWTQRVGMGPDPGAVIGDTRAGVGFHNGPFEASVGYLYREIRPRDWDMLDAQTNRESLVAFRVSFHPGGR